MQLKKTLDHENKIATSFVPRELFAARLRRMHAEYFCDSFDCFALNRERLEPLAPKSAGECPTAVFR